MASSFFSGLNTDLGAWLWLQNSIRDQLQYSESLDLLSDLIWNSMWRFCGDRLCTVLHGSVLVSVSACAF